MDIIHKYDDLMLVGKLSPVPQNYMVFEADVSSETNIEWSQEEEDQHGMLYSDDNNKECVEIVRIFY